MLKIATKDTFYDHFFKSFDALKKNNWELQKKLVHDGVNPSEIAIAIREDNVEKLQEISAQTNFDFNQKIVPSLYERCTIVNENNVSLINYAAFSVPLNVLSFYY